MEEGQSLASTPSGDWIFHGLGHKIKTIPSWLKLAQVVAIENLPLEGSLRDSHLQVFVHIWKFSKKSLIFFRGKIKRFFGQFSPHGWIEFQWNPLSSFERYLHPNSFGISIHTLNLTLLLPGGGHICPPHHVFAYTRVCMRIRVLIFCDFSSFWVWKRIQQVWP